MIDEAFRAIPRTLPAIDGFGNRRISGAAAGAAPHGRAQQRSPVPGCRGNTYTVRRRASGVILRPPARPRHRRADAAFVTARGAGRVAGMRRCGAPAVRRLCAIEHQKRALRERRALLDQPGSFSPLPVSTLVSRTVSRTVSLRSVVSFLTTTSSPFTTVLATTGSSRVRVTSTVLSSNG